MTLDEIIFQYTKPIDAIDEPGIAPFRWLAQSITESKEKLRRNSVKFIVIKILNRSQQLYKFERKYFFDVYVFGSFRKHFRPAYSVAEAFSEFYLEMGILPNIISVPNSYLKGNEDRIIKSIKNGVLIYARTRSLS